MTERGGMGRGGKEAQAHMQLYIYTCVCVLMGESHCMAETNTTL